MKTVNIFTIKIAFNLWQQIYLGGPVRLRDISNVKISRASFFINVNHQQIRFNILHTLYQKYYSPELEQAQDTEKIIQESGLGDIDKNQVAGGDIVYLENKNLINGMPLIGHVYSPWIKITSYGVDSVENIVDKFVEKEGCDTNDEVKSRIKELSQETDTSKKIKSIIEFAKTNTGLLAPYSEIVSRIDIRMY
jgi:uncharacterized protein YheU (UPF0270 family)